MYLFGWQKDLQAFKYQCQYTFHWLVVLIIRLRRSPNHFQVKQMHISAFIQYDNNFQCDHRGEVINLRTLTYSICVKNCVVFAMDFLCLFRTHSCRYCDGKIVFAPTAGRMPRNLFIDLTKVSTHQRKSSEGSLEKNRWECKTG